MYFRKYRIPKTWVDKWLKSRVSEDPKTDNKQNGSGHCRSLGDSTFTQSLLNALKVLALEKVSSSDTQNSKAFC